VDELGGLLELTRVAEAGRYDTVVVDTAPTGHTLRLLTVPETLGRIAAILGEMLAKHHFLLTRLSGRDRRDAADELVAEIDTEARGLAALLATRPAAASGGWSCPRRSRSRRRGRPSRRSKPAASRSTRSSSIARPCSPGLDASVDRRRVAAERSAVAAVRTAFLGHPIRLVPDLATEPRGPAALRPIVRALGRRAQEGARLAPAPAAPSLLRPSSARRRESAAAWMPLVVPAGTRLLLFAGKGGVGKTTCAAAAALTLGDGAAAPRILLLSTDPAHSLGDVLGARVGDDERTIPGGPTAVRVRELDAGRMFERRRARYRAAVDELFDAIRGDSRLDIAFDRTVARDLLDLAPGGLDELCALLAVTEALFPPAAAAAPHDLVVVDTAPTGHTLRLLALPGLALEWIRALLTTLLKYRQVLGLGALAEDLVELSRGLRQLQALLADPRQARVVVVTRPAALPRLETLRLLRRLESLRLTVSALVVNALAPPGVDGARAEATELARLGAAARRRREPVPLLLAPLVAPPPRGVAALRGWARTWTRAAS
jgi:arsenite-transporting ATPase